MAVLLGRGLRSRLVRYDLVQTVFARDEVNFDVSIGINGEREPEESF
jgi:hypothetical protein